MKSFLATALAASAMAFFIVPSGPASAAMPTCASTRPNTSLLLYRSGTGAAVTGTLSAGHWQQTATLTLPTGYTSGAASRDTLILYNKNTGAGEVGTFVNGKYTRVTTYNNFSTGWTAITASRDSVLFYNSNNNHAGVGYLIHGTYQGMSSYNDLPGVHAANIASSCDTVSISSVSWKDVGYVMGNSLTYGTLEYGKYLDSRTRQLPDTVWKTDGTGTTNRGAGLGSLVSTRDSLLGSRVFDLKGTHDIQVATAQYGDVGPISDIGTTGDWQMIGRTSDSLMFYKTEGNVATAWTSTFTRGNHANVGPVAGLAPNYTMIVGGV
ncbi:hypothetical protein [Streptomyces sp. NPDC003710]